MNVYFISGVGADRRVFHNIRVPEGFTVHHLDWITPAKNESLPSYAKRLANAIDRSQPFILVGLSFGGMLANEIDKLYHAEKVILISSVPSSDHLPPYFRLAGKLGLEKIVPVTILKSMSLLKRLFTVETTEEKKFLRQAIRDADPEFIRWSLTAIVRWKCKTPPRNYIQIHGSSDLILPLRFAGSTHTIKKAGHLMVLVRAKEINGIIREELRR